MVPHCQFAHTIDTQRNINTNQQLQEILLSNFIWIIAVGFIAGLIVRFVSPGPYGAFRLFSHDRSRDRRRIRCNLYWPDHRPVSARSGRGSYRRDRWRSDNRVDHLEPACGSPFISDPSAGPQGRGAIVKPHAHEFLNNAMAKTSLLIVTELGAYRSNTWD